MALVLVHVEGVGLDPNQGPVVVLKDADDERILPIWIGPNEANAIQMKLDGQEYVRPLTHDLIKNLIVSLKARVTKVEIQSLKETTYYAEIVLKTPTGEVRIDARPSDSIAVALRCEAPIYADESLFRLPGVVGSQNEQGEPIDEKSEAELAEERKTNLRRRVRSIDPSQFGFFRLSG